MATPAQRERTQLRRQIPNKGRGGGDIDESDLLQMWPKYLDMERSAAKRTLSLPDVAVMLESSRHQLSTPCSHGRCLSVKWR